MADIRELVTQYAQMSDAEKDAEYARQMREIWTEAYKYLSYRFSNVRNEEVSNRLARDVHTMLRLRDDCRDCRDITRCRHSHYLLDVVEEWERGFRTFVVRAMPCEAAQSEQERKAV